MDSLRAQAVIDRIVVTLPDEFERFPGRVDVPQLGAKVDVLRHPIDLGPATKIIPAAALSQPDDILIYCDDDWSYGPHWAAGLLSAYKAMPHKAQAVSTFEATRIGRAYGTIAQGFAGVLVRAGMLAPFEPPLQAFKTVDDVWLSGLLAKNRVDIKAHPTLRSCVQPTGNDAAALQSDPRRATLNKACAAEVSKRFGVWRHDRLNLIQPAKKPS